MFWLPSFGSLLAWCLCSHGASQKLPGGVMSNACLLELDSSAMSFPLQNSIKWWLINAFGKVSRILGSSFIPTNPHCQLLFYFVLVLHHKNPIKINTSRSCPWKNYNDSPAAQYSQCSIWSHTTKARKTFWKKAIQPVLLNPTWFRK